MISFQSWACSLIHFSYVSSVFLFICPIIFQVDHLFFWFYQLFFWFSLIKYRVIRNTQTTNPNPQLVFSWRGVFGKDFSLIRKQSVWYSCSGWPFSYWKVGQKGQEIGFQVSFKASIFFWVHLRCPKNSHLKSSNFLRSKPWVGPTRYVHALPGHEWCAVRCWSSSLG